MNPVALEQHGLALKNAGRVAEAVAVFQHLVRLTPKAHGAFYNLGNCYMAAGELEAAVEAYRRALRLAPRFAPALNNLGFAQIHLRQFARAAEALAKAAAIDPANAASQHMAGHALLQDGRAAEALPYLERAVALAPREAPILTDYADALRRLGRLTEAAAPARAAAALAPERIEVWNNLANAERDAYCFDAAEQASRQALAIDPNSAEAHCNLALTLLAKGDLPEGFAHWEHRWRNFTGGKAPFPEPPWQGEALQDGLLLLHDEQGFGDVIQFCRYVPLAARRARVALAVRKPLLRLMRSLQADFTLYAEADPVPAYAAQAPLMSLPRAFGTDAATIPAEIPYLAAEPAAVAAWRDKLAALPGLRIGLAWAGNKDFAHDAARSIPPTYFDKLATLTGVSFVSLQKDAAARPGFPMLDLTGALVDFADTAALIEALDLVISVDTVIIHLAGALGKPAFLLNRFAGDWRWGPDGRSSPWYPSVRVFRQAQPGDWQGVMDAVVQALGEQV